MLTDFSKSNLFKLNHFAFIRQLQVHITHLFVFDYFIFTGVHKYCTIRKNAVNIGQNPHYENNLDRNIDPREMSKFSCHYYQIGLYFDLDHVGPSKSQIKWSERNKYDSHNRTYFYFLLCNASFFSLSSSSEITVRYLRPLSAKLFRAKFNHSKVQLAQNSV